MKWAWGWAFLACSWHAVVGAIDLPIAPTPPTLAPGQGGNPALPGQGTPTQFQPSSLGRNFSRAQCNADVQKSVYPPPESPPLPFPTTIFNQGQTNQLVASSTSYIIYVAQFSGGAQICPSAISSTNLQGLVGGATATFIVLNYQQPWLYFPTVTIADLVPARMCTGDGANASFALCLYSNATGTQVGGANYAFTGSQLNYVVDTRIPPACTISNVGLGDSQLILTITNPVDPAYAYQVCYTTTSGTALAENADCSGDGFMLLPANSSPVSVNSLTNGTTYYMKARTFISNDSTGFGKWSDVISAAPIQGFTPMELYDGVPNPTQFSCASSHQNPYSGWMFLLLAFFLRIRRGRSA